MAVTGRSGGAVRTKLGLLLMGDYGTWKSSIALESMKFKIPEIDKKGNVTYRPARVLYIDCENGSVDTYLEDYENEGYDLANMFLVYTQDLSEVRELIRIAKDDEDFEAEDENGNIITPLDAEGNPFRCDVIVVDGMTMLYNARQQVLTKFSEKRARVRADGKDSITATQREVMIEGADMEFKEWGRIKKDGYSLTLELVGSGKHFICTTFASDEKVDHPDGKRDKQGNIIRVRTGNYIPEGFKDLPKYCKTVWYLYEEDSDIKALVQRKDRTQTNSQGDIIESPSLTVFQPVLEKNLDKKLQVVKNKFDETVEKDELVSGKKSTAKKEAVEESIEESTGNAEPTDAQGYIEAIMNKLNEYDKTNIKRKEVTAGIKKSGFAKPSEVKTSEDVEKLKATYETIKDI